MAYIAGTLFLILEKTMEIVITWSVIKWAGLPLFVLALFAFFFGSLPDNEGLGFANGLRWLVWPLFLVWLITIFVAGLNS